ncbi:Serine/threonine exchanger SteT [Diplonema papillatum]|nr:Serine/threonine exchanger SteT [Diplonema papillatum]
MRYEAADGDPEDDFGEGDASPCSAGGAGSAARKMSAVTAAAYCTGTIIGSGIYSSPLEIVSRTQSGGAALAVWLACGLICTAGGLAYVELAGRFPTASGEFDYIRILYGDAASFLYAWTNTVATRPSSLALVCTIFGDNIRRAVGYDGNYATKRLPALAAIALLAGVNCLETHNSAAFQRYITAFKICCLVGLVGLIAAPAARGDDIHFSTALEFNGTSTSLGDWGVAFMNGLWAYDGWANLSYVVVEMRDPLQVKYAMMMGIGLCIVVYLLVNVAYMAVLDPSGADGTTTVAVEYLEAVLHDDRAATVAASIIVAASTLGAGNGMLFASSRIAYAGSAYGFLPPCLSIRSERPNSAPVNSVACQAVMAALLVFFLDANQLVVYFGTTAFVFYLLVVAGTMLIRIRERLSGGVRPPGDESTEGSFRVPMACSAAFVAFSLVLVLSPLFSGDPFATVGALAVIASGFPVWLLLPCIPRGRVGESSVLSQLAPTWQSPTALPRTTEHTLTEARLIEMHRGAVNTSSEGRGSKGNTESEEAILSSDGDSMQA